MKDKKNTAFRWVLLNPERVLVAMGLVFVAITIFITSLLNLSTKPVNSPRMDEALMQQSRKDTVLIDINTANKDELKLLPGIGDELAKRIVDYREENGFFASVEDLKNVSGIGEKKIDDLRYYIVCSHK